VETPNIDGDTSIFGLAISQNIEILAWLTVRLTQAQQLGI
jgi:hypothetical protein